MFPKSFNAEKTHQDTNKTQAFLANPVVGFDARSPKITR